MPRHQSLGTSDFSFYENIQTSEGNHGNHKREILRNILMLATMQTVKLKSKMGHNFNFY